jgi:hypothetical protein
MHIAAATQHVRASPPERVQTRYSVLQPASYFATQCITLQRNAARQTHRGNADSASSAVHEHGLAWLYSATFDQAVVRSVVPMLYQMLQRHARTRGCTRARTHAHTNAHARTRIQSMGYPPNSGMRCHP